MPNREVYRALSSEARSEIIKLLYKRPHDIEEIAKNLNLQPVTIRHHVQALQEAGLLECYEQRSGSAGRPKTYYKLAKILPYVSFPTRRYLDFSRALVNSLSDYLGQKKAYELIADVGRQMAKSTVKYLEAENKITSWTPKNFADFFVEKYLRDMGTEPEIVEKTDKLIVYRTHNCLFYELSQEMPSLMCDVLHCQFHEALLEAMSGQFKGIQTKCMGHGEDCCEHVIQWIQQEDKGTAPKSES